LKGVGEGLCFFVSFRIFFCRAKREIFFQNLPSCYIFIGFRAIIDF
jgi:hypothetical protein